MISMFMNDEKPKTLQECLERLKKGCEKLYDEYEYPEDYSQFNSPATEEELQKFEERLGFVLPEAYREFLKFSNGAMIDGLEIYGVNMIGTIDEYIPDGYLAISYREMTSERLAISKKDGEIYIFWDLHGDKWNFEEMVMGMLSECEGNIAVAMEKVENSKKDPEIRKKEAETLASKWEKIIAESEKKNK